MKPVKLLKTVSKKYAKESADSAFELSHRKHVADYSKKLAKSRYLDSNLALLIAYGHDLGRTKEGFIGKGHALAGSNFCSSLLKNETHLSNKKIKKVAKAISLHSKKKIIDDSYCELIKDADSLAHYKEGLISEDDWAELYRVYASKIDSIDIKVSPIDNWHEVWKNNLESLLEDSDSQDIYSPSWVHKKRIAIRQLKIINKYFIKLDKRNKEFLKSLNSLLNTYFHSLENPRKYFVLTEFVKSLNLDLEELQLLLEGDLAESTQEIEIILKDNDVYNKLAHLIEISTEKLYLPSDKIIKKYKLDAIWTKDYKNLIDIIANSENESNYDFHDARIIGKKFKYLYDLNLIDFSSKHLYKSIADFHKASGDLHDIDDLYNYLNNYLDSELNIDELFLSMNHEEEALYEKCSRVLFFYKLLKKN